MTFLRSSLLGSAAAFAVVGAAHAADLPVTKAAPIEYVRICNTEGVGFFYIPGTDTCLRLSGRARFETGFQSNENRNVGTQVGDISQFRSLARLNVDARTQTEYGTLRAFLRLELASRTGAFIYSGTQLRQANAFPALGLDQFNRVQQYVNVDKAFIQFAGLTAGRASSFFDFYAHDFEIIGVSASSDVFSTNLLAYTATLGNGFSATLSMEDPNFRKNNVYNATAAAAPVMTGSSAANVFFNLNAPTPVILAQNGTGNASIVTFQDVIEKSRLPNFVGVLRLDQAWGSAQLSAAVADVNISGTFNGGFLTGAGVATPTTGQAAALAAARGIRGGSATDYGFAVQAGVKLNLPFIAPGDTLYLEGAYTSGAGNYNGGCVYDGCLQNSAPVVNGGPFNRFQVDAVLNPLTDRIQLTQSFSVVGAYLHYWVPAWRSAFFASYNQNNYGSGARAALSLTSDLVGSAAGATSVVTSPALFGLSPILRDNYQIYAGMNLIWSPVQDLDIGVEGVYINSGVTSGRVLDQTKVTGVNAANFNTLLAAGSIKTLNNFDAAQVRMRIQRDF